MAANFFVIFNQDSQILVVCMCGVSFGDFFEWTDMTLNFLLYVVRVFKAESAIVLPCVLTNTAQHWRATADACPRKLQNFPSKLGNFRRDYQRANFVITMTPRAPQRFTPATARKVRGYRRTSLGLQPVSLE